MEQTKPTNPKDLIGTNKVPLSLFPATAVAVGSVAMLDGALKYGRDNYRAIGVRASIYVDACLRHLTAWMEGEDATTDSNVDHLGHALACLAIIIDAQAAGLLNDDRKIAGGYQATIDRLTPLVAALRAQHADKDPKHYTIADNAVTSPTIGAPRWKCSGCGSTEQWPSYAQQPFNARLADEMGGRQCNKTGCDARTPNV